MKQLPHGIKGKACGCAQARSINRRTVLTARVALEAVLQACSGDQKQCGHQLKRGLESRSTKEHLGVQQWHRPLLMKELEQSRRDRAVVTRM